MRDACVNEKREKAEDSIDGVICALCADLPRRRHLIAERKCTRRVEMEFRYINYHLTEAAKEIVGDKLADVFLSEIGTHVGYAYSAVDCYSERMYKVRKQEIKHNIARHLHLVD